VGDLEGASGAAAELDKRHFVLIFFLVSEGHLKDEVSS
jgi:hypothetical protein